jgi:hypothetical protein
MLPAFSDCCIAILATEFSFAELKIITGNETNGETSSFWEESLIILFEDKTSVQYTELVTLYRQICNHLKPEDKNTFISAITCVV